MTHWQNYHLARSIPDALQALTTAPGPARIVGGGTDLLLDLQQGRHPPVHTLVDVTAVPEMTVIEIRADRRDASAGRLYIGAGVTHSQIVASPFVAAHAQALIEACGLVGGPQVRNTATLGGNVAHALPAADGAIALLALNATVEIASPEGTRRAPLIDLYRGPGRSSLEPQRELLTGFYLPLRGGRQASAFRRVMRPQGVALPILNMACWLERIGDVISDVRIAIGPASPLPVRAKSAESTLRGKSPDSETLAAALAALLSEVHLRTSPHRATAEYRRHLCSVLLEDTLQSAWERA